jgi:hypothetical protein
MLWLRKELKESGKGKNPLYLQELLEQHENKDYL